jgi:hypothetical protein
MRDIKIKHIYNKDVLTLIERYKELTQSELLELLNKDIGYLKRLQIILNELIKENKIKRIYIIRVYTYCDRESYLILECNKIEKILYAYIPNILREKGKEY